MTARAADVTGRICPPSGRIAASTRGLGRPWDTVVLETDPPPPTSLLIPCSGPHCISVRSPAGEEAKKDGSPLPSKEERSLRQEFDPWTDDITWREIVNYLSAALISSPPLKILYLNLSATGNKVFVKRPSFWLHDGLFAVTDLPHHCSYFVFVRKKKKNPPKTQWRNPVCRHSMRSEWFYLMHCELSGPPSGQFSLAWLGGEREELVCWLACVRVSCRACVCVSMEGRHCSLTSPLSPACRCSQTRLCYSEASTGDRPSAKHGAPPADLLERRGRLQRFTRVWEVRGEMLNKSEYNVIISLAITFLLGVD